MPSLNIRAELTANDMLLLETPNQVHQFLYGFGNIKILYKILAREKLPLKRVQGEMAHIPVGIPG